MLCINEDIQEQLQLPIVETKLAQTADGRRIECPIVAPIEMHFKNRKYFGSAMVLPGNSELLLGAIPMEDMDLILNPLRQELTLNPDNPDIALMKTKRFTKPIREGAWQTRVSKRPE